MPELPKQVIRAGTLYVVATPIGNLGDISFRALHILANVDVVAAEDTRHTRQLFQRLNIQNDLLSLHDHNERDRANEIIQRLEQGQSVALVSDAGTPAISDPGFILVRAVREAGLMLSPIPGASAVIAALSVAGLPTDAFLFDGFLPAKHKARCDAYARYQQESRTAVVYESSHRIESSIEDLVLTLGAERHVAICREISKLYETILSGQASEVLNALQNDANQQRGEFVVLIEGVAASQDPISDQDLLRVLKPLAQALPPKQAAALTAEITGCKKKEAYNLALSLKTSSQD